MKQKQIAFRLTVVVLFVAVAFLFLVLVLESEDVSGKTWYVDDGGGEDFEKIQDAIDAADEGDTIRVWEGIYYENVEIDKTVTLVGNGSANTTIDGGGSYDVVRIEADYVNLSGFIITNSSSPGSGIYSKKDHGTFKVLNLTDNYYGIYLKTSEKNTIRDSEFYANTKVGIHLYSSNDNLVTKNILKKNEDGVALFLSSLNEISWNTAMDNTDDGIDIDPGSTFNQVSNNIATKNDFGIICTAAPYNTIANNTVQYNTYTGISLYLESHNNTIVNNTASLNAGFGIAIYASNDSLITKNTISQNGVAGPVPIIGGVYTNLSHNNTISHNEITFNNDYGLFLVDSIEYTIMNCTFAGNNDGISITGEGQYIRVFWSSIYGNTHYGINVTNNNGYSINATENWWGHASGPYHPTENSNGTGGNVTDDVEFKPWLTLPFDYFSPEAFINSIGTDQVTYTDNVLVGMAVHFSCHGRAFESVTRYVWLSSINGTLYNGSETSFSLSNLSHGEHVISLKVQDNYGVWSHEVNVVLIVNAIPLVTIATPANNSEVHGIVTITGTSSDDDGDDTIQKVEISMDDGGWITGTGTTTWSYEWDSTKWKDGNHKIEVRAYDGKNFSYIVIWYLNVKNQEDTEKPPEEDGSDDFLTDFSETGSIVCLIVGGLGLNLIFAIWMYRDAENRGEDGKVYFLFGLFCSFIGCFIWLLCRPKY